MVIDVVDGDTIDVILPDGSRERVRMLGIDTPETTAEENEPNEYDEITDLNCLAEWGLKAKQYTSKLEGKYVWIELDSLAGMRGYYGRLLDTEGTFGKESEYLRYQDTAMESGLGLWGACTVAQTPIQKGVLIAYVNYDAPGNDNYNPNGEYVVIRNYGADPVNLIGWKLRDEAGHTYIFPDYTLESGGTVYVHSGKGTDSDGRLYWGSSHAIWNNGGDTAYLYDSTGKLVDSYSW
ncbi:nuclease [Archaeoglobales archaeon ex4484_92]|nr:MAG: nuclease [Archaeoglobales archaeon ex4484_92]